MRKIGEIPQDDEARLFCDHLYAQGIACEAEENSAGVWSVWVHDDRDLDRAEEELARFTANPADPVYRGTRGAARAIQKQEKRDATQSRMKVVDLRTKLGEASATRPGFLAGGLMLLSVAVTIAQTVPPTEGIYNILTISNPAGWHRGLPEVMRGEVWRLFTPVFLHFGILHIFCNATWLWSLGNAIEAVEGTLRFAAMVLVMALVTNLAQFAWSGPAFGGMSGVVYGLFGYTWMCVKYDPARPYILERGIVATMIAWFFLCMTGLLGPIGNASHAAGLVLGVLWGAWTVRRVPFTGIRF